MSFDSRLRDELRHAAEVHDLREDAALQHVKATIPSQWSDLTVVALERSDTPSSTSARAQRIVGALAACVLVAGVIAIPFALRDRSRDAVPPAAGHTGSARYRSTVTVRVATTPAVTTTRPAYYAATDIQRLALAPATRNAALTRSNMGPNEVIGFATALNPTGDLLDLTVNAPTRVGAQTVARNWAAAFVDARRTDAKRKVRDQQHALSVRVRELHDRLRIVDDHLVELLPDVYKNVKRLDAPNSRLPGTPPTETVLPVPEQGSVEALNFAYERIQILSELTETGEQAAALRVTAVRSDVVAQIISQTPAVELHRPGRDMGTVVLVIGLIVGGLLLLAGTFLLGRRSRRPQPS